MQDNNMNSNSVGDLNVLNEKILMKLEELKETVAGGRLTTKKSLTGKIPEFSSSLDPAPSIIRLQR
jgi:hypothetical protein